MTSLLTERFDTALAYASRLHRAQSRKGTAIPYLSHLLAVAAIALELGADEDQAIAALLHDAVEDQGGAPVMAAIQAMFGDRVAAMVADCSDADSWPKPPWHERKRAYIASLAHKDPGSLLVSLADKIHNASAIAEDLRHHGDAVWERFNAGKDDCLWYYRALAEAFAARIPGPGAQRLARAVDEIARLSS